MKKLTSAFLTKELVQQAFNSIRPTLEALIKSEGGDRNVVCLAVLEPCKTIYTADHPEIIWVGNAGEDNHDNWKSPEYSDFARTKAMITWRTGIDTHIMKTDFPHLFEVGDLKYGGGINHFGIIVGASGLPEGADVLAAQMLAEKCREFVKAVFAEELLRPVHYVLK